MTKHSGKVVKTKKLTPRQSKFIDEYLIDLNATQAAIRSGYSQRTARTIAANLLAHVNIQRHITIKREQMAADAGVTQERVIKEYARIAFLDPSQFYDENGNMVPIQDLEKDISATIAGMDHVIRYIGTGDDKTKDVEHTRKIKICDKLKALEALSRHLGIFEKDNKQKQSDALEVLLDKIANQGSPKPKSDDTDQCE